MFLWAWVVIGLAFLISAVGLGLAIWAYIQNQTVTETTNETLAGRTVTNLVVNSDLTVEDNFIAQTASVGGNVTATTAAQGAALIVVDQVKVGSQIVNEPAFRRVVNSVEYVQCSLLEPLNFILPGGSTNTQVNLAALLASGDLQFQAGSPALFGLQSNATQKTVSVLTLTSGIWYLQLKVKYNLFEVSTLKYNVRVRLLAYNSTLILDPTDASNGSGVLAQQDVSNRDEAIPSEVRLGLVVQLPTAFGYDAALDINRIGFDVYLDYPSTEQDRSCQLVKVVCSASRLL